MKVYCSILRPAMGALALAMASALCAQQHSFYTRPDIHGDMVAFTCEGDLWLASITNGQARRITSDVGVERNARFSPDGTMIAFNGQYDRAGEVYVMPVIGGAPRRLTYDPSGPVVLGWTPDSKSIIYRSSHESTSSYINKL